MGSKEFTLDDFHSISLDKLDRFTCLNQCSTVLPQEGEVFSSDEDDDEDDDDDDETAELQRELEQIKRERAEKREREVGFHILRRNLSVSLFLAAGAAS